MDVRAEFRLERRQLRRPLLLLEVLVVEELEVLANQEHCQVQLDVMVE